MRILTAGAVAVVLLAAHPAAAIDIHPAEPDANHLLLAGGKAKGKGNGGGVFVPPGQAKKWARGQYLPKTLIWTPAPAAIIAKLKPVPPGHRYVVVDGEVLLVALATGLILDVFDVI